MLRGGGDGNFWFDLGKMVPGRGAMSRENLKGTQDASRSMPCTEMALILPTNPWPSLGLPWKIKEYDRNVNQCQQKQILKFVLGQGDQKGQRLFTNSLFSVYSFHTSHTSSEGKNSIKKLAECLK